MKGGPELRDDYPPDLTPNTELPAEAWKQVKFILVPREALCQSCALVLLLILCTELQSKECVFTFLSKFKIWPMFEAETGNFSIIFMVKLGI